MAGSADAIAHVAEGIIVNANPAWLELFGYSEDDALTGQPLMDLFEVRQPCRRSRARWWPACRANGPTTAARSHAVAHRRLRARAGAGDQQG